MTAARWVRAAPFAALVAADGLLGVRVEGADIVLYVVDGALFATADRCTHGAARLSEGYLDGHLIECPLHQGLFDIRDGAAAGPPCSRPVRIYPVRRDGDDVLVDLAD